MGELQGDRYHGRDLSSPRSTRSLARAAIWLLHMALPLLGLWLLVERPDYDGRWEHHGAHFWLVAAAAAVSAVLSARVHAAATRHTDPRLALVSLAFLSAAGFLFLHALGTPGVLVDTNRGFVASTPIGLVLASVFAAASAFELDGRIGQAVLRWLPRLRVGLLVVFVIWGYASVAEVPPLDSSVTPTEAHGPLVVIALCGGAVYLAACVAYVRIYRRRPAVMLLGLLTGFALLGEALISVAWGRNWQASWWEWHGLMTAGFAFILYSAHVQYRREGTTTALFAGIGTDATVNQVRAELGSAVEAMVDAMRVRLEGADDQHAPVAAQVAARFDLSEGQTTVLEQAADALAQDREDLRRLRELSALSGSARVVTQEQVLLETSLARVADAFRNSSVAIGLLVDGTMRFPPVLRVGDEAMAGLDVYEAAVVVKGHPAGVLRVGRRRPLSDRDRAMIDSFAGQLSVSLENTRLYRHIDVLFRQYMSPDIVTALLADPTQANLGGAVVEVTSLFADLRGFTSFSERTSPAAVVELLNQYFGLAIPELLAHGGTVTQFAGDNVMAVFNAPARQEDHALRAGRAALAMQAAVRRAAPSDPDAPLFRVGINTGPALVGNVGAEVRCYTANGDSVNLAARLESLAPPGGVVIGEATLAAIGGAAVVEPLGDLQVKGKREPVRAFTLLSLRS